MRFAITTLGCKVNQYDSAAIAARLAAHGLEQCSFDEVADVYLVNTCTVTGRADAESLRLARRARRLNPGARVVMTGCLAQANPAVLARTHEVDAVVGIGRPGDLERAVTEGLPERVAVSNLRKERAPIDSFAVVLPGQTRAFLKVQEGCDQFCSFCVVPLSRGMSRSVAPRSVLEAVEELAARGFKEITLSGVHLGGYGRDLDPPVELAGLLEMLAERSPISRIRISSLDPEELSDRVIEVLATSDKFCPHLHLPLQSGEDATLVRMRRRYSTADYRTLLGRVLERIPTAAVGTDLMVGFPGETPADFTRYLEFVASLPLAYFHVFPYSVRAGTTAAKFAARVTAAEISRRAEALRELGEERRRQFARRFTGHRLKVLFEEKRADGMLAGYSRNYLRVLAEGGDELKNHEVEIETSRARGAQLLGRIAGPGAQCEGRPAAQTASL